MLVAPNVVHTSTWIGRRLKFHSLLEYESRLELASNAGELYALGDEMAERGDRARAVQAFRAILTRFPDNALAAKAADRLADGVR